MTIIRKFLLFFPCLLIFNQCILVLDVEKEKNREEELLGLVFLYDYFSPFGVQQQRSAKYSEREVLLVGGNSQKTYATANVYKLTEDQVSYIGSMHHLEYNMKLSLCKIVKY